MALLLVGRLGRALSPALLGRAWRRATVTYGQKHLHRSAACRSTSDDFRCASSEIDESYMLDGWMQFVGRTLLPTEHGVLSIRAYRNTRDGKEVLALSLGEVRGGHSVPLRVHDQCFTSEVLGSLKCDCKDQLLMAIRACQHFGFGVVLYLQQEGRGIGLANKIAAYGLQERLGLDTVDANRVLGLPDESRQYDCVPSILRDLGIASVRLMTNNPYKIGELTRLGVHIDGRIPLEAPPNPVSAPYLAAKAARMNHLLSVGGGQFRYPHSSFSISSAVASLSSESVAAAAAAASHVVKGAVAAVDSLERETSVGMSECAGAVRSTSCCDGGVASAVVRQFRLPAELRGGPVETALDTLAEVIREQREETDRALSNWPHPNPTSAASAPTRVPRTYGSVDSKGGFHKERLPTSPLPFVTATWAQSVDGSIAGPLGEPLRLSGSSAMAMTHAIRALHDAVLVGVGTALSDNPLLTCREEGGLEIRGPAYAWGKGEEVQQPHAVVVDGDLQTPPDARLITSRSQNAGDSRAIILTNDVGLEHLSFLGKSLLGGETAHSSFSGALSLESVCLSPECQKKRQRLHRLLEAGASVIVCNSAPPVHRSPSLGTRREKDNGGACRRETDSARRVDLVQALCLLRRGGAEIRSDGIGLGDPVASVMVEGGARILRSFLGGGGVSPSARGVQAPSPSPSESAQQGKGRGALVEERGASVTTLAYAVIVTVAPTLVGGLSVFPSSHSSEVGVQRDLQKDRERERETTSNSQHLSGHSHSAQQQQQQPVGLERRLGSSLLSFDAGRDRVYFGLKTRGETSLGERRAGESGLQDSST